MLHLKEASLEAIDQTWQFVRNMPLDENGLTNQWHGVSREEYESIALPAMIAHAKGENLPEGYVPETYFFLWDDDTIVGQFRIRHYLCESLRSGAGHIGYFIQKQYRGRGYATKGLKLTLEAAAKLVLEDEIYLRVNKDNPASLRVMLKNGGMIHHEDEAKTYVRIPNHRPNLELIRLTAAHKEAAADMMTEWKNDIETNHTDSSPWKIWAVDFHDFDAYLRWLDAKPDSASGWVPDTTLFALDKDRNRLVGAVNIRHDLNENLLRTGGHIGDGIRPSERRKGYATAMIALALEECRKLGIDRVLMCCDKSNLGSAKSILRNGGVLENEIEDGGETVQRYWIQL